MPVVIPYTFVGGVGNKAKASEVNANFAALAAKFSEGAGGILDADISTTAAIKGSKLNTTPGLRIPTAALEDEAVTDAKVASDAAIPGADAGRAIGGEHIKLLTAAQMARFLPNAPTAGIGSNKLKATFHAVPFSFTVGSSSVTEQATNPTSAFAKATYELIGLFIKNLGITGGAGLGIAAGHASDSGANWAGAVRAMALTGGTLTVAGDLVYVFAEKA